MAQPTVWSAALIGDMIASRRASDRARLQGEMESVFRSVADQIGGGPAFTIGDEFQARYPTLAEAVEASLQFHLRATGLIRLRIGIGWGELIAEDPERTPFGQDGPCWWRARDAIEAVDRSSRGRGPRRRTAVRTETPADSLLNNYLLLRDTVLDGFDEVDSRIALGLMAGESQTDLADELGINKSSVSRRATSHGVLALVASRDIGVLPLIPGT